MLDGLKKEKKKKTSFRAISIVLYILSVIGKKILNNNLVKTNILKKPRNFQHNTFQVKKDGMFKE